MIDDPELIQLVEAAKDLMTLQSLAVYLQNHRHSDELDSVIETFNRIQQMVTEAMSRRIVELALLHHDSMEPPTT